MRAKFGILILLLISLSGSLLTGCNSAQPSPTPVPPTITTAPTTAPLPTVSSPVNKGPTVKNYSLVTGSVVKIEPDRVNQSFSRVTLNVTSTSHVESYPSFTDGKVGQEIDVLIDPAQAGTLAVGNTIQVKVTYRGDENGAKFYGSELILQP